MSYIELKACPCCGAGATMVTQNKKVGTVARHTYFRAYVKCKGCGLTTPQKPSSEKAAKAWNTRPGER